MGKDTKRDMEKEELEVEVAIVEVEADKNESDKTETVKEDFVEEQAIVLTPEQEAFIKEKSVPKKYDRTLDPVFKYFFGRECNEELLLSLINGLLSTDVGITNLDFASGGPIFPTKFKKVTLLNTDGAPLVAGGKGVLFDVLAETEDGELINVEIQRCKQAYLPQRAESYASNLLTRYNEQGTEYLAMKRVISIWIIDWIIDSPIETEKVIRAAGSCWFDTRLAMNFVKLMYFVQLPKMTMSNYKELRQRGIMTVEAEAWTRFLVTGGSDDGWEAMNAMSPEIARKLQKQEQEFWSNKAQRYAYIVADDQERVRLTDRKIALEEGRQKGREEGREQGLAEKEQELIFDMLSAGFSDEQITALPSITKEKLEKYKEAYKK